MNLRSHPIANQAATAGAQGFLYIDPPVIKKMQERLTCLKPDHVMTELGISLNTWKKLLDGEPIRASVAQRVILRFGQPAQPGL